MNAAIVIPARMESTRLPRKMLLSETGKPLIQHTVEAARRCHKARRVLVAVDHHEVLAAVRRFGGETVMTAPDHQSGTDRIAEVARGLSDCELVVNLQGDEPEIEPAVIDAAIELIENSPFADVSTAACPIRSRNLLDDPSCVKVVMRRDGRALYFSRSAIPHARSWNEGLLEADPPIFYQHLGVYVYRREFLLRFSHLPNSSLEKTEMLEQLRILQAGSEIVVAVTDKHAKGIDTLDDYRAFVSRQARC